MATSGPGTSALVIAPEATPLTQATLEACRQSLRVHARTFALASLFLSRDQRDRAAVLYAWCRAVDDAVDETDQADVARTRLAPLRPNADNPAPVAKAFFALAGRSHIPMRAAEQLVQAMELDLEPVRIEDDASLLRYAHGAAGVVGVMMCGVIGAPGPQAWPFAVDLGIAMQLTNICRDIAEDARRGRVYLPASRLAAVGLTPDDVLAERAPHELLAQVVRDVLAVADKYYKSADAGMHWIPTRARLAIVAASRIYRAIGLVVASRPASWLHRRAVVSPWKKLRWLLQAILWAPRAPGHAKTHDAQLHQHLVGCVGAEPPRFFPLPAPAYPRAPHSP